MKEYNIISYRILKYNIIYDGTSYYNIIIEGSFSVAICSSNHDFIFVSSCWGWHRKSHFSSRLIYININIWIWCLKVRNWTCYTISCNCIKAIINNNICSTRCQFKALSSNLPNWYDCTTINNYDRVDNRRKSSSLITFYSNFISKSSTWYRHCKSHLSSDLININITVRICC